MILVLGSINTDLVARVRSIPRPGETVLSAGYATLFGGKGANQAVAAARALRGTGIAVAMAGAVGDDAFGRAAIENLAENGVAVDLVRTVPEPTGCAFITVDEDGENAITVASGANASVRADAMTEPFDPSDVLVLQMEIPFAEALAAARRARAGGARVIWNLAPAPDDLARSDLADLLAATSILVVNETEALAAARIIGRDADNAEAAAVAVVAAGDATVVVTRGARGALALAPGETGLEVPAPPIRAVDTTGAGDTFVGVLAAALAEGLDLSVALRRACLSASLACLHEGAQAGMPDRKALDGASPP